MFKQAVLLAIILTLILVVPVLAQDGSTQPTPDDLSNAIMTFMAGVAALLGAALVDAIKRLPFLTEGDKSKLTGPVAQLVSVVVSIISGYLVALVGQGFGLIDDAGLKALLVTIATPVFAELRYRLVKLAPQGR
jgi:hypothetical protein